MKDSLKDAIQDLDDVLVRTLCVLWIEVADQGYHATLKFAFYGPNLDDMKETESGEWRTDTVAQYPDIVISLKGDRTPEDYINELRESGIVGQLTAFQIPPHYGGNPTNHAKWVVQAHAGSQAEWIAWLASIA